MTAGLFTAHPDVLGPYRLVGRLGSGGMGEVYLGRSPNGRVVAVKVIRPEFAADPTFRARFAREVATAKNVNGNFTALVVDADPYGPVPWLATEYITGPSLADAVRDNGPLPLRSLMPLVAGLAKALSAIHAAGVVHRDLKPSNVLLAADGPRVIDFGISYAAEASKLTRTGEVLGTLGYMSPEQVEGLPVGPESDIFSLGAVIAFTAAGAGPFGDGSSVTIAYRTVHNPPALGGVPEELHPLVERCLTKDPGGRPSLDELLAAWGGGEEIMSNWLPAEVADTLTRYKPDARIIEIAAKEGLTPPVNAENGPNEILSTTPPLSWHRRPRRAGAAIVAVVIVAALAAWAALRIASPGPRGDSPGALTTGGTTTTATSTPTATPSVSANRTSAAPARSGSPAVTAPAHAPAPTATAPAPTSEAASSATSAAATATAQQSSPGPTGPISSVGPITATNGTAHTCVAYPSDGFATFTNANFKWVNNSAKSVYIYYTAPLTIVGSPDILPPHSAAPLTELLGGTYLVQSPNGTCIGYVTLDATPGQVTIS